MTSSMVNDERLPFFFTGEALGAAFVLAGDFTASLAASTGALATLAGTSASTAFGAARFRPLAGVAEALLVDGIGSGAFAAAFGAGVLAAYK